MTDAAYYFSRYAVETSFEALPERVVETVKRILIDDIACMIAGANENISKKAFEVFSEFGGRQEAAAFVGSEKLPAASSALINAVAGTSLDYNDLNESAHTHVGISCVPTALAMAQKLGKAVSGRDIICALAVGMETGCRLGLAAIKKYPNHVMGGWVYCSLHASIMSAIVAGKLLKLTQEQMRSAIGIAYHQAAGNGLAAFDGTDVRLFGAGFAARNGIQAALMAQKGISGTQDSIDSNELSLMNLYHNGARPGLTEGLGERYELLDTGFKAYPCCGLGHRQIDAISELINLNSIASEQISCIELSVPELVYKQLCSHCGDTMPENKSKAQFDLRWQAACAATQGKLGLLQFEDNCLTSPQIGEMMKKVTVQCDPGLADETVPAQVLIIASGNVYSKKTEARYGSPEKPFTNERLLEKMIECADYGRFLTAQEASRACEYILEIDNKDDISELFALLRL